MSHILLMAAVIGTLFVVNLINNRMAKKSYLLVCLCGTAALLGIALLDGLSWTDLGLGKSTLYDGLLWSGVVFALVVVFYAIAATLPFSRRGFADKRAAEQGWLSLLYNSMIRIPLGTALLEEVAFRGVLLAIGAQVWAQSAHEGFWAGALISSVLFGLWHILPSLEFHESNEAAGILGEGRPGQVKSVILTVLGTAAAGLGFCVLRDFSGSLLPPFVLHASLNAIGLAVSWAFARRLREL